MSTNIYFDPTLDPTALPLIDGPCGSAHGITASHLLQLVRELQPAEGFGFVVYGNTAPDVGTYPELSRFLWVDTNDTPHVLKEWDGSGWSAFTPADDSLNGRVLIDNSVALAKLAVSVADIGKVLIARSGGPQWESVIDNIGAGTIPLSKLSAPAVPIGAYLTLTAANTLGWQVLHGEDIISRIVNGTLPINRLVAPGATVGHVLKVHTDNTIITAADAVGGGGDPAELPAYTGADSGKKLQVNGAGDGVEWVSIPTPTQPSKYISSELSLPTQPGTTGTINADGRIVMAHGFTGGPHTVEAYLICQSTDGGYAAGARISIADVYGYAPPGSYNELYRPLFQVFSDATNVYVVKAANPNQVSDWALTLGFTPSASQNTVIELTKWKVQIVAIKFN